MLNASQLSAYSRRFADAYAAAMRPLAQETGLPQGAVDILLFLANNPDYKTARDIVEVRHIKANLVSVNVDKLVQEVVRALNNMSRKRIGALIVFERHTGLADVIDSGTVIDGEISAPLIENIFEPNTPLHDGAVIMRGGRIVAAACYLPLSENYSISRELGTRHRAAIGISETTDATVLVVSEETGVISVAREGKLTRYFDAKALKKLLMDLFQPAEDSSKKTLLGMFRAAPGRKAKQHEEEK